MAGKLSFKKQARETGLSAIARPYPSTDIKNNKKVCGVISAPSRFGHENWKIGLIIKDDTDVAGWRWVFLKGSLPTEEAAREWVKTNWEAINQKFELSTYED